MFLLLSVLELVVFRLFLLLFLLLLLPHQQSIQAHLALVLQLRLVLSLQVKKLLLLLLLRSVPAQVERLLNPPVLSVPVSVSSLIALPQRSQQTTPKYMPNVLQVVVAERAAVEMVEAIVVEITVSTQITVGSVNFLRCLSRFCSSSCNYVAYSR